MGKKREDGFTVGAIEQGLAAFATGKPHRVGTVKPTKKNDPVGRFRGVRAKLADHGFGTSRRRTQVDNRDTDMGVRKSDTREKASALGHTLGAWHKRSGDRYGREDAHCIDCNDTVTVCVVAPVDYSLPLVYGDAIKRECITMVTKA